MDTINTTFRKLIRSVNDVAALFDDNDVIVCEFCFEKRKSEDFCEEYCDSIDSLICTQCVKDSEQANEDFAIDSANFYQ